MAAIATAAASAARILLVDFFRCIGLSRHRRRVVHGVEVRRGQRRSKGLFG
jgi:hypothetical protein